MRYGNPSIESVMEALRRQGTEQILLLPLYPQFSGTTTATAFDEAFRVLSTWRNQPELRLVKHFHDHPAYIAALPAGGRLLGQHGMPDFARGDKLILSFHGLPRRLLDLGDPYHCECLKTGRLLGEALGLQPGQYQVTFQSRFGKAEWLQPYTRRRWPNWARSGRSAWTCSVPAFRPTASRRSRKSRWRGSRVPRGGRQGFPFHSVPERCRGLDRRLADIALQHLQGWPLRQPHPHELEARRSAAHARRGGLRRAAGKERTTCKSISNPMRGCASTNGCGARDSSRRARWRPRRWSGAG
jgi:ferrochelatase